MAKRQNFKGGNAKQAKLPRDRLLPRFTTAFFDRPLLTALLWVVLIVFGAASYTTLLRREGFPSVNIPVAIVSGTYFVNDPAKVDSQVAKPISDIALKQSDTKLVQSQSSDNFFMVQIQYKDGTDSKKATNELEQAVKSSRNLPANAQIQYNVPYFGATGGDVQQIDAAISFYNKNGSAPAAQTVAQAQAAAAWLNDQHLSLVKDVFVKNPFETVTNPSTGQPVKVQHNFDRFGISQNGQTRFYNSVLIGVAAVKNVDVIKLDDQVRAAVNRLQQQPQFINYGANVSASFAPNIKENISELQRVLLEGLIAVLIVGSIVIAIRASLITVVSMVTVLLISLGLLYLIGYSLNVITLFALILGLALIVDDTIIMVEAIDAARRRNQNARAAVKEAATRISRAMVAATTTACLSFAPLLFVGGILGAFIRAIPVTIISSLIISLFVALIFIPFMSRFVLLGKKQMGAKGVEEPAAGAEAAIAAFIARPMLWARNSKKKLFSIGILAIVIGFGFVTVGLFIAKDIVFNIFPPTKDTNGLIVSMNFPPGTTVNQANQIAAQADKVTAGVLGSNFEQSSYYNSGSAQSATAVIQIIPYSQRKVTSPQLVKQLQDRFNSQFKRAQVAVAQSDVGPPSSSFIVQLNGTSRDSAFKAARALAAYLKTAELKRPSGKVARFENVNISSASEYDRTQAKPIVTVMAGFDGNDTSTLVTLAQNAVKKEFDANRLKQYGLAANALSFDIGQESDNQNSFKTLVLAFPILLAVMYILLALEFRSFLQPLLIFMAIPFSIFGVMLGLRLTNNAISFFTLLGFFALLGLSIKNTILLTDYANQARRSGMGAIDAAHAALAERFRPLFATSVTAVVSLIPLAITSPFWQGLAVVLIFGLLSSTFLVVTVFPYYYLGAEYLRLHISPRHFFTWLILTAVVAFIAAKLFGGAYGALVFPMSLLLVIFQVYFRRRLIRA